MMTVMNVWGHQARNHWTQHRPVSYAQLEDQETFFAALGEEAAARHESLRDSLLDGLNPNEGKIGWADFQDRTIQADQTAREIVEREMIYLPPGDLDQVKNQPDE